VTGKSFYLVTCHLSLVTEVNMPASFIENYKAKHRHPLNRMTHNIGIPMIVVSLVLFFFNWRWALALFIVGWILQFVGHLIEGNRPAFFRNPVYLLVGPWWLIRRAASALGLLKSSSSE
jgi:uncharacterized membrane protein YGL010W